MKLSTLCVFAALLLLGFSVGRADDMKGMESKDGSMRDMPMDQQPAAKTYHAVGVVKKVDGIKGSVTISHGPVAGLNWPAMTMTFAVKDKSLLQQVASGKKVDVEFVVEGSNYTIIKVN